MYVSTRGNGLHLNAAQAIISGLADDGGLLVPEVIPTVSINDLKKLCHLTYQQRVKFILSCFLTDFKQEELEACIYNAYNTEKFDMPEIAPLRPITEFLHVLELWHGPTAAFKDMALQLLPQLLSTALRKTAISDEIVILVATSGDTGKAALEGFKDVRQTRIIVFYPQNGVSEIQRLQMVTQEGNNTSVVAVNGNFDDAQTGVKQIFNDETVKNLIAKRGFRLSSANSINWGRLVPQIVYYFSAYADLLKNESIQCGEKINFVVPTGNFGNILAAYYAMRMGLPVHKLICASNANDVLTEFLQTGVYNRKRQFYKTISPSMDILVSSNLERLLYHLCNDPGQVKEYMTALETEGCYAVTKEIYQKIADVFWAGFADDEMTTAKIKQVYNTCHYVADPHTAVAWHVYNEYKQATGDTTPTVLVSTASPFKFAHSVNNALNGHQGSADDEFRLLDELAALTQWDVPASLAALKRKSVRHEQTCAKNVMKDMVLKTLNC